MNKKSFATGFLIASIMFGGYNVFGIGGKVEAYLKDDYKIEVDGIEIKRPDDMRILNFGDRTYTPTRLIAEAMNGKVEWDDATKTIKITKPEPEVVEKIVEKIVEVPSDSKINYQSVPLKLTKKDFTINVTGISIQDNLTYIYLDAENKTGEAIEVDFSNAKIKSESGNYSSNAMSATDWGNSLDTDEKREGRVMVFDKIADSDKEITLSIPIKSLVGSSVKETFDFNIKVE